jgi:hypothetical protein
MAKRTVKESTVLVVSSFDEVAAAVAALAVQ